LVTHPVPAPSSITSPSPDRGTQAAILRARRSELGHTAPTSAGWRIHSRRKIDGALLPIHERRRVSAGNGADWVRSSRSAGASVSFMRLRSWRDCRRAEVSTNRLRVDIAKARQRDDRNMLDQGGVATARGQCKADAVSRLVERPLYGALRTPKGS
jgi:hypothetical protein